MVPNNLNLILTFSFSLLFALFTAIYTIVRNKMVKHETEDNLPHYFYSKSRIAKIAFANLILTMVALVYCATLLFSVVTKSSTQFELSSPGLGLTLAFFVTSLFISYGAGLYVISIIKEQFTTKSLRLHPEYKILYITNEFFHGPVSHVYIYSGGLAMFFIISLLEVLYPGRHLASSTELGIYGLSGVLMGTTLLIAQIYNQTWKHQMPYMSAILCVYLITTIFNPLEFSKHPFNMFFLIVATITCAGLIVKHLVFLIQRQIYKYDRLSRL